MDRSFVVSKGGAGGDTNIIHIDMDGGSERFMFENGVVVDVVHHGLERRWRIGKPKIHNRGFKKSISCFERGLLLVSFTNTYVIVSPSYVEFGIDICIAEIADEVCDQGEGVLISNRNGIDFPIVLYRS